MTFIVQIDNDEDKDDDTDAGPTRYMSGVTDPKVGSEIPIRNFVWKIRNPPLIIATLAFLRIKW